MLSRMQEVRKNVERLFHSLPFDFNRPRHGFGNMRVWVWLICAMELGKRQ